MTVFLVYFLCSDQTCQYTKGTRVEILAVKFDVLKMTFYKVGVESAIRQSKGVESVNVRKSRDHICPQKKVLCQKYNLICGQSLK